MIRYALFDLDETLYPREAGVLRAVGRRIERYLVERMQLPPPEAARLRTEYREAYGTTLGGLLAHHAIDPEDYLSYVHDVPVEEMLRPSAELDRALAALPWERVIFTNSDQRHTERVLAALGVRHRFSRIFEITGMGYRQKPHPSVYRLVLAGLGADGSACLLVDDALPNLIAGRDWEMTTVWVGPAAAPADGIDYCIREIAGIARVAAQLEAQRRARHGG